MDRISLTLLVPLLLNASPGLSAPVSPATRHPSPLAFLRVGEAGHAFDHLGAIGDQAEAAAASGATILYVTGFGGLGYAGLPAPEDLTKRRADTLAYLRNARRNGIRLALGYICATSIVGLETFDKNWPAELREGLDTPPSQWLQQDRNGKPLL